MITLALSVYIIYAIPVFAGDTDSPFLKGPYLGQKPPGDTPEVFAPGIVSTGKEHSAAMFTPDGNEVWFGRLLPSMIYYMKQIDGVWSGPQIASFSDSMANPLYPVLSPDGNKIYFSSRRMIDDRNRILPRGDFHIWVSERVNNRWSEPEHLDQTVNFGPRQSCGSITTDGDIYFASFDNKGTMDLYFSELIDGHYSDAIRLIELSSSAPDHSPFISPDGSYLIFSSFRGGMGRSDLFISFRDQDGKWCKPKSMGPGVNSAYKDEYPFVTPDGKYLFFNSNRPSPYNPKAITDGPGNIYWVDAGIIERLRSGE